MCAYILSTHAADFVCKRDSATINHENNPGMKAGMHDVSTDGPATWLGWSQPNKKLIKVRSGQWTCFAAQHQILHNCSLLRIALILFEQHAACCGMAEADGLVLLHACCQLEEAHIVDRSADAAILLQLMMPFALLQPNLSG
eukprot:359461-Chlamydomonas_euryale.AAC.6